MRPIEPQPLDYNQESSNYCSVTFVRMNKRGVIVSLGVYITVLLTSIATADNSDAVVNERFTVDAKALEVHWQVDCDKALKRTLLWLKKTDTEGAGLDWHALMWRDLQLCGFIYNHPGNSRYRACPNFRGAVEVLKEMQEKDVLDQSKVVIKRLLC